MAKAGTMKELLGDNYMDIVSLKIVGPINGDDLYYLHEMSAQKMQGILKTLAKNQSGDELIYCITDVLKQLGIQNQTTDPVVAKVVQYVYDNYHMPNLNLQYIADEVIYLTPRYIGRRFLNVMNIKFSDFLLKVRMEKAVAFLKRGDNSSTSESEITKYKPLIINTF